MCSYVKAMQTQSDIFTSLRTAVNYIYARQITSTCPRSSCILRALETNTPTSKGKAVPLQAWSGQKGSRKLRFPDFMTTAQDDGKFVSFTHRPPLPPGNAPGTHLEAESTPGP